MHEVTVTHTIQLPDGYELAPGLQPRVPTEEDVNAAYYSLLGPFSPNAATASTLQAGVKYNHKYFVLRRKPIGVKLTFVDVRKFENVPKDGFYGVLEGPGIISGTTAKKHFENKDYGSTSRAMLVSYYTTEPIYSPAS